MPVLAIRSSVQEIGQQITIQNSDSKGVLRSLWGGYITYIQKIRKISTDTIEFIVEI